MYFSFPVSSHSLTACNATLPEKFKMNPRDSQYGLPGEERCFTLKFFGDQANFSDINVLIQALLVLEK